MAKRQLDTSLFLRLCLVCVAGSTVLVAQPPMGSSNMVPVPQVDWGWEMLEVRAFAQQLTVDQFQVDYDFQFADRLSATGIRFANQITPDSGKYYQPNHYDHGNGVLVADVDGDQLYDLYFVSQLGGNELWRNLGDGRFEDITEAAGVGLGDRVGVTASFADFDNDGDPDLYVTTVKTGNVLFVNDGNGVFSDVTESAGLGYTGHSSGAAWFDYDNDGLLDLFLTNVGVYTVNRQSPEGHWIGIGIGTTGKSAFKGHMVPDRTEHSILYRNKGKGRFEDVSETTGLRDPGWSGDAAFADVNGDRLLDLYVLNMQGDDHFWINEGGKRFREATDDYFPKTPWGSMGVEFFDYDNDGSARSAVDRHALRHEPQGDSRFREAQVAGTGSGRGAPGQRQQHLRQRLLCQWGVRSLARAVGCSRARELLALGRQRRRSQRRRLGGRLHQLQYELPLRVRHQLGSAQQSG